MTDLSEIESKCTWDNYVNIEFNGFARFIFMPCRTSYS